MKKVFILTVANSSKAVAIFEDGSRMKCESLKELENFDTSGLRILETSYNKMGKFILYSSADFRNRQSRDAFKLNEA